LAKQVDSSENQNFAYEGLDADVGMWFHRTSINGYTSFVNGRLTELLYNMGLCNYSNDAYINYLGGSPVTNIIFNIKYAVGRYETGFSDVETVTQENDMYLYEMKHNLGTAYMVDSDVLEWESGGNVFEQQNRLVKAMTQADDVFLPLQDEVKCYTLEGECEKSEENVYSYKLLNEYDNVSISYEVSKDADLYMYLNNTLYGQCNVYVDDELVFRSKDLCKQQMVHIGKVQKGQRIRVTPVNHYKAGKEGEISCDMAEFNEEAFEKFYSELQDEQLTVEQYEEGNIQGSINVKQDGVLMTSIPALKGWTVYVDGVKMEYESVMDQALIALPLEGGKHTIEFRYVTPYFTVSLLVTCIGVIFTVLYWVVGKRKRGSI
jgi:uncharacterized membrane protein YfhO